MHAERTIEKYASVTAALIIEPLVQGAAGMLIQPPGYVKRIRELCTKNNILMIADEVATGFGRTGKMFACEHEQVTPDILCTAKGITGGYLPLAATLTTEEIYRGFLGEYQEFRTFFHGHTYTGNPLACAASIASIDLFKKEKTLARLQPKIAYLKKELARFSELKHVGNIRQKGFMVGIELVKDRATKMPYPSVDKIGARISTGLPHAGAHYPSPRGCYRAHAAALDIASGTQTNGADRVYVDQACNGNQLTVLAYSLFSGSAPSGTCGAALSIVLHEPIDLFHCI